LKPAWLEAAANAVAVARPVATTVLPDVVEERVVYIDGDVLAYYCSGNDETPVGIARRNVIDRVNNLRDFSGAAKARVQLTMQGGSKGERFLIATAKPYQGNRQSGRKPANWEALRVFLETHDPNLHTGFVVDRYTDREADDGFARASYRSPDPVRDVAIASSDKDMRMLAGLHIDWKDYTLTPVPKGSYEVIGPYNGLVYGHKWFWLQMLQGDTADNIPGLPLYFGKRIGEKGAETVLKGTTCNQEAFEVVAEGYAGHYAEAWTDAFVEQAALLWLRTSDRAPLADFLRIVPGTPEIMDAVERLARRVREKREEINCITAKAHALEHGAQTGERLPDHEA
jgi:DNA polymerase-1